MRAGVFEERARRISRLDVAGHRMHADREKSAHEVSDELRSKSEALIRRQQIQLVEIAGAVSAANASRESDELTLRVHDEKHEPAIIWFRERLAPLPFAQL